jgi:hypothetical protein
VSAGQTIAKLEALLARVRARGAEPRTARAAALAPAPAAALPLAASDELLDDEEVDQPTLPPPPVAPAPAFAESAPARASTRPPVLELSVDIDVAVEEPEALEAEATTQAPVSDAMSSQERLVAVEATAHESMPEPEARDLAVQPEAQAAAEAAAGEDEREEPPISSRRPTAPEPEERLAEMAFGAQEPRPPLHTPPPESGRLPAAPAVEFGDEDTGVRSAVVAPAAVTAETTRAELAGSDRVAAVHGSVRAFNPASFAELLEASLGL